MALIERIESRADADLIRDLLASAAECLMDLAAIERLRHSIKYEEVYIMAYSDPLSQLVAT